MFFKSYVHLLQSEIFKNTLVSGWKDKWILRKIFRKSTPKAVFLTPNQKSPFFRGGNTHFTSRKLGVNFFETINFCKIFKNGSSSYQKEKNHLLGTVFFPILL